MIRLIILSAFLVLVVSCKNRSEQNSIKKYLNENIAVDSENVPTMPNQAYFPAEIFRDSGEYVYDGTTTVIWYSKHLYAMEEPLLYNRIPDSETFRFLWLRTEDPPIAIRIEHKKEEYQLTLKICDGAGGYDPGNLILNKTKAIDKATWDSFAELIEKTDFWNAKTTDSNVGLDGSQWILESADKNRYHVVDRWSPQSGSFYDCCMFLIKLVQEDIPGGVY